MGDIGNNFIIQTFFLSLPGLSSNMRLLKGSGGVRHADIKADHILWALDQTNKFVVKFVCGELSIG